MGSEPVNRQVVAAGVAEPGAAQAFDFAGAGRGAFDQATAEEEVLDGGEAVEVTDVAGDAR